MLLEQADLIDELNDFRRVQIISPASRVSTSTERSTAVQNTNQHSVSNLQTLPSCQARAGEQEQTFSGTFKSSGSGSTGMFEALENQGPFGALQREREYVTLNKRLLYWHLG